MNGPLYPGKHPLGLRKLFIARSYILRIPIQTPFFILQTIQGGRASPLYEPADAVIPRSASVQMRFTICERKTVSYASNFVLVHDSVLAPMTGLGGSIYEWGRPQQMLTKTLSDFSSKD